MNQPIIKELYDYIQLERITLEDGNRFYITPDGNKVSSVTTILSATDTNNGLLEWRNRVGNKMADSIVDEACILGTLMHEHLECHIQGLERPKGNNYLRLLSKNMANEIIDNGFPKINLVLGMEKMLYFPGAYAGTADLIAEVDGVPSICDYKSCRKMKSKDKIESYFCQVAAYALAHNFLYDTDIKQGVIFMVDRDLNYKEYIIKDEEFTNACDIWIKRLEVFLKNQSIKSKIKG